MQIHPYESITLPYTTLFRSLAEPEKLDEVFADKKSFDTEQAEELGLITFAPDDLDWEDEIRVAIEERTSLSPDALTGMERSEEHTSELQSQFHIVWRILLEK